MGKIWNLEQFAEKIAVRDEFGRQLTYTDLNTEANRLAEKVGRRCLVFSLCRNEIGSLIGYIGFVNNGIVSVQLSSHLDDSLLQNLLTTYQPAFIWTPKDQTEQFADSEIIYSSFDYCLLKTGYEKEYPLFPELGLLITTSGSTGSPKFVRQSYTNLLDNAASIAEYLKLDSLERPSKQRKQPHSAVFPILMKCSTSSVFTE